jgi:uncharacterized protein (TIGR02271 family)
MKRSGEKWEGRPVIDAGGENVGHVEQAYGEHDGWPDVVVVNAGQRLVALPAERAVLTRFGLQLPSFRSSLDDATVVDSAGRSLDDDVVARVLGREGRFTRPLSEADDAMTLSEEQLRVGREVVEAERVRLRKRIVEEEVHVPITLRREELEVVRTPTPDLDSVAAVDAELLDGEFGDEIVLFGERAVLDREVVPVERIRLGKEVVTEHVTVERDLRREEAEVETSGVTGIEGDVRTDAAPPRATP